MPDVADYKVIQDTEFTLGINEEKSFTFQVPNNFSIFSRDPADSSSRAILNFKFNPSSDANNLEFIVSLNDQLISSLGNIDSRPRQLESEIFASTILRTITSNTLQFQVRPFPGIPSSGAIGFSDVVIWYQVSV